MMEKLIGAVIKVFAAKGIANEAVFDIRSGTSGEAAAWIWVKGLD